VWRKYNDMNVTEEVEQEVLKEAKGVKATSAYYLVYSLEIVLVPARNPDQLVLRNYEISSGSHYMKDYYSTMVPTDLKKAIGI
jgi:hypothetical protein